MEIVDALLTLKETCKSNINCNTCPLAIPSYDNNKRIYCCGLTDITPSYWVIDKNGERYLKEV